RILPLRDQWQKQELEFRQRLAADDARRRKELTADAEEAANFQAMRTVLLERLQRKDIPQAEFDRNDKLAEQEILKLQEKYNAYGPNWGNLFTLTVARLTPGVVTKIKSNKEAAAALAAVAPDVQRAVQLSLAIRKNQIFRERQAITPQRERELNAVL